MKAEKNGGGFGATPLKYLNVPEQASDSESVSSSKSGDGGSHNSNSVWSKTFRSRLYQRKSRDRIPSAAADKIQSDLIEDDHEESDVSGSDQGDNKNDRSSVAHPRLSFICSPPKQRLSSTKQRMDRRSGRNRLRRSSGTAFKLALRKAAGYGSDALRKDSSQPEDSENPNQP